MSAQEEDTTLAIGASASSHGSVPAPLKARHRFSFLLIAELVLILGFPFTLRSDWRAHLFGLLAVAVFAASLYAVMGRGRITLIAVLLGVPAILIRLANVCGYLLPLELYALALGIVFLAFVTGVLIRTIVGDLTVTVDTLAGAVSAYLLIGITYGLAYGLIELVAPGSFRDTVQPGKVIHPPEFIFFSFVTLTTVGYGDIVPWSGHARSLVILEAVTGIMYPAVLIGRLIGLHLGKRPQV